MRASTPPTGVEYVPPPKKKHGVLFWGMIAGLVVALGACVGGLFTVASGPDSTPGAAPETHVAPIAKQLPPKNVKEGRPVSIDAGTWHVGTDVKAGKYQTIGADDTSIPLCYWDVRTGSEDGTIKTQGVKNTPTAKGYVTLKNGEYFTTSGCQPWTPVS